MMTVIEDGDHVTILEFCLPQFHCLFILQLMDIWVVSNLELF